MTGPPAAAAAAALAGACTYCKTKHARGELGSYDPQALLERVMLAVEDPLVSLVFLCLPASLWSAGHDRRVVRVWALLPGLQPLTCDGLSLCLRVHGLSW